MTIENQEGIKVISQRQYGIIAPGLDINGVNTLLTVGLTECFGLAIFDPNAAVGLFAHADATDGLVDMLHKELGLLKRLGGKSFRIETVNVAATKFIEMIENRQKGLPKLEEYLRRNRLLDSSNPDYFIDLGNATAACLDATSGLHILTEPVVLTPTQSASIISGANRLSDYMGRHNNRLPGYQKVYEPSIRRGK